MGKFNFYCLITSRKISEFIFFQIAYQDFPCCVLEHEKAIFNSKHSNDKYISNHLIPDQRSAKASNATVVVFPNACWTCLRRLEYVPPSFKLFFHSVGVRRAGFGGNSLKWIYCWFSHRLRIAFSWQHLVTIRIVVSALMECVAKILFHPFRRKILLHTLYG